MNLDKISQEKLFQNHSKETVKNWCKSLAFFYYMRARAGHNCEGDSFAAHFKYEGKEDLIEKLSLLDVQLNFLPPNAVVFDPFETYSLLDLDRIKYTVPHMPDIEQPQDVVVMGYRVYIWVQANCFEISISGTESTHAYEISNADFEACLAFEKKFLEWNWLSILDENIKSHTHCISEKKYPELYL